MPLVATIKKTNKRWDITEIDYPELGAHDVTCPGCSGSMTPVRGMFRKPHFRHLNVTECPDAYYRNESNEHLEGKRWLKENLPRIPEWANAYKGATLALEYRLHNEGTNRTADLMVTTKSGEREVHEVQYSAVPLEELDARTSDYERLGITVYWWFGLNTDTDKYRLWSENKFGFSLLLPVQTRTRSVELRPAS